AEANTDRLVCADEVDGVAVGELAEPAGSSDGLDDAVTGGEPVFAGATHLAQDGDLHAAGGDHDGNLGRLDDGGDPRRRERLRLFRQLADERDGADVGKRDGAVCADGEGTAELRLSADGDDERVANAHAFIGGSWLSARGWNVLGPDVLGARAAAHRGEQRDEGERLRESCLHVSITFDLYSSKVDGRLRRRFDR